MQLWVCRIMVSLRRWIFRHQK